MRDCLPPPSVDAAGRTQAGVSRGGTHAGRLVLVGLDLLGIDSPVAVLLLHSHKRDDVEPVIGQSKAVPDGYLTRGFSRLDDVRVNEFHRNVVLDEP